MWSWTCSRNVAQGTLSLLCLGANGLLLISFESSTLNPASILKISAPQTVMQAAADGFAGLDSRAGALERADPAALVEELSRLVALFVRFPHPLPIHEHVLHTKTGGHWEFKAKCLKSILH